MAVPFFILSVSGLSLLLAVGMAGAQPRPVEIKPKEVMVQKVTELPLSRALEILEKDGLRVEVRGKTESDDVSVETVRDQDPASGSMLSSGAVVTLETLVPIGVVPPVVVPLGDGPLWVIVTILAAAVLVGEGYRRLAKRRHRRRDDPHKAIRGFEIHAVPDEGKQRLGRSPTAVSSLGLVVHPDNDGRQSVRHHRER